MTSSARPQTAGSLPEAAARGQHQPATLLLRGGMDFRQDKAVTAEMAVEQVESAVFLQPGQEPAHLIEPNPLQEVGVVLAQPAILLQTPIEAAGLGPGLAQLFVYVGGGQLLD